MSFTTVAAVTGNRVGTQAAVVLCSVAVCMRFVQSQRTWLTLPARGTPNGDWTPTAVLVDRILTNVVRSTTESLKLTPLIGIPPGSKIAPVPCGTFTPFWNLTVGTGTVTLVWWIEGTVNVPTLGITRLPVRSSPMVVTCVVSNASNGHWITAVNVTCLGCALVPGLSVVPMPTCQTGRFSAVSVIPGNVVGGPRSF